MNDADYASVGLVFYLVRGLMLVTENQNWALAEVKPAQFGRPRTLGRGGVELSWTVVLLRSSLVGSTLLSQLAVQW